MAKFNGRLLPIKAHYFFFMAAMGPILPQTNVFGKELGISPDVMGFITSLLPILYILAKPAVGYLIDSCPDLRKTIFMSIVLLMILCYGGFSLIPTIPVRNITKQSAYNFSKNDGACTDPLLTVKNAHLCLIEHKMVQCSMDCARNVTQIGFIGMYNARSHINLSNDAAPAYHLCMDSTLGLNAFRINSTCQSIQCIPDANESFDNGGCFYGTATFWLFVLAVCVGTIGFNVSNCVSDATCFDMLGDKTMHYGAQRVWGTIGFGLTALISGIMVHTFQLDSADAVKALTPALITMLIFGVCDIFTIKWLQLPRFTNEEQTIASKVFDLLKQRQILVFLCFATLAGIIDSFIIYYMFWYLEEIAQGTGHMDRIKLIEGCVVAAECLGGEILFFLISGKILKCIGYVHCMSVCFFMYFIRLALISIIPNPWWLILIEFFMQGSSYALCYTCIVGYASEVAPPGTSATVQGLVAGMDDGVGFAIGSLVGGQLYRRLGGTNSFRIFAAGALITCFAHILIRPANECGQKSPKRKEQKGIAYDCDKKQSMYPNSADVSSLLQTPSETINNCCPPI